MKFPWLTASRGGLYSLAWGLVVWSLRDRDDQGHDTHTLLPSAQQRERDARPYAGWSCVRVGLNTERGKSQSPPRASRGVPKGATRAASPVSPEKKRTRLNGLPVYGPENRGEGEARSTLGTFAFFTKHGKNELLIYKILLPISKFWYIYNKN